MNKKIASILAVAGLLGVSGTAGAAGATLGLPPPDEQIVSRDGLEWVYAGPCAPFGGCGDVLLHDGFGLADDAQWLASFATLGDLTSAFAGLCASPWFNTVWDHCDHNNAADGYVWGSPLAPDAFHRDHPASETFLVRGHRTVPEPASLALLGLGLAGLGLSRRRKTN